VEGGSIRVAVASGDRNEALVASLLLLFVFAGACAKARPVVDGSRCVSWKDQIGPLFASECASCHTGATPAGAYSTDTYLGVLGGGSDAVPDAVAGDASSRLVTVLDPATVDAAHAPFTASYVEVKSWVVDCGLSFVQASVHRAGILDPASPDFHGNLLRAEKYDFGQCQKCHGSDYSGGTSSVSCLSCHTKGPTDCSTCHGDIAKSGSHAHHLGNGPLGKTFDCSECHIKPKAYTDVGHIFLADGTLDPPPAEVTLGVMAALTPPGGTRAAHPSYDSTTQTCSDVYCHGAVFRDSAATNVQPTWSKPSTGQADCGTCHGLPPNHLNSDKCASCHPAVVDRDEKIIAPDLHVDGQVELASPATKCAGCHGTMASPAPPPDLAGETSPSALGVGAHAAHLQGTSNLRGPIACDECHKVPTAVADPGHLGGHQAGEDLYPAEVFPADPTVGVLASTDGAHPAWNHDTATCASVYCHGGGATLAADTTADIDRAPVWTATGGLACGSACHGLPPAFSPHLPTMTRTDCASCHPRTVDPAGDIILSGPPGGETSAHMNGVLDVAP
jgi:predicted CxxxxCH...CXXCH cytochrome family protein